MIVTPEIGTAFLSATMPETVLVTGGTLGVVFPPEPLPPPPHAAIRHSASADVKNSSGLAFRTKWLFILNLRMGCRHFQD